MHFYIFMLEIVSIPFVIISYKDWGIIIIISLEYLWSNDY
jgi:hypothetical protein